MGVPGGNVTACAVGGAIPGPGSEGDPDQRGWIRDVRNGNTIVVLTSYDVVRN